MTDWREIVKKDYNETYSYEVYHDDQYGSEYSEEHRAFEIWATKGAQRYIPVDRVIDPNDAEEVAVMLAGAVAHMPLYLLAHGSVSVGTSPYLDLYDSGQCGFAVITNPDAHGISVGPDGDWESVITGLVKEYDAVLRGQVVGWVIRKKTSCDSCKNTKEEVVDGVSGYVMVDYKAIDGIIESEIIPNIEILIKDEKEATHGPESVIAGDD
jgi:hypothetical protein